MWQTCLTHQQALWCAAADRRTPEHQTKRWSHPGAPRLSRCKEQRCILSLMNSSFIFIWLTESEPWPTLMHKHRYKCKRRLSPRCKCDGKKTKNPVKAIFPFRIPGTKMVSACLVRSPHREVQVWLVQCSFPLLSDWLHFQFVTLIRNKWSLFPKLFSVSNQNLQLEVPFSHKHQADQHSQPLDSREPLIIAGSS